MYQSMLSEYLLINAGIIAFPLAMSFEKKVRFYKKLPAVLVSTIVVGVFFIIWDIYATHNSHWMFNPEFTNGIKLFGLPLEEILFFITVPYSMIFLYETFRHYLNDKIRFNIRFRFIALVLSFILFIAGILLYHNAYTFIVLISCAVYFFISYYLSSNINSGLFWIFMLFSFIPFLLVNYLLTSLPVVLYSPAAILGFRVLTIPIEDFFYSFSLIGFYIMVYSSAKGKGFQKASA